MRAQDWARHLVHPRTSHHTIHLCGWVAWHTLTAIDLRCGCFRIRRGSFRGKPMQPQDAVMSTSVPGRFLLMHTTTIPDSAVRSSSNDTPLPTTDARAWTEFIKAAHRHVFDVCEFLYPASGDLLGKSSKAFVRIPSARVSLLGSHCQRSCF